MPLEMMEVGLTFIGEIISKTQYEVWRVVITHSISLHKPLDDFPFVHKSWSHLEIRLTGHHLHIPLLCDRLEFGLTF